MKNAVRLGHFQNGTSKNISTIFMKSSEAEAVKLFSNAYLALRISYFNELDTYAKINDLDTGTIINGVCLDPRIGNYYNNPSFGYGGYCLPKDTKQLENSMYGFPVSLITSISKSNEARKSFVSKYIVDLAYKKGAKTIGIYRLVMKEDSDNFRSSSTIDILKNINNNDLDIIIYEPLLELKMFNGIKIEYNLFDFKNKSDLIIANRFSSELNDVCEKVFTPDVIRR